MSTSHFFILFFLIFILMGAVIAALISVILFLSSVVRGAPYAKTSKENMQKVLELAQVQKSDRCVDLGSGDGRLVVALAQEGSEAYGYEINLWHVLKSRRNIRRSKIRNAKIFWGSFWSVDVSYYDVIVVFGIPYIMKELERKLQKELKPGARVVSNGFAFPTWKFAKKLDKVYLYVKM